MDILNTNLYEPIANEWKNGILIKVILFVSIWILSGTLFYCYYDEGGWAEGFYYDINISFTIGWGVPWDAFSEGSVIFTLFWLYIGKIIVTFGIIFFTEIALYNSLTWFQTYLKFKIVQEDQNLTKTETWLQSFDRIYSDHIITIHLSVLVIVLIFVGAIFGMSMYEWNIYESVYFALSCMSTAGIVSIPLDSPSWCFGFVGVYAAVGILSLNLAFGFIGTSILKVFLYQRAERALREPVTEEERRILSRMRWEAYCSSDYEVLKKQYLLLLNIRLGLINFHVIDFICEHFDSLEGGESKSEGGEREVLSLDQGTSPSFPPFSNPVFALPAKKSEEGSLSSPSPSSHYTFPSSRPPQRDQEEVEEAEEKADERTFLLGRRN